MTGRRHPYRHHGPAIHGSKLADFLISEASLQEDRRARAKEPGYDAGVKEGKRIMLRRVGWAMLAAGSLLVVLGVLGQALAS